MIALADIAKTHGLALTADGAIDFAGGRIVAFGDSLVWHTTIRPTSAEAAIAIRKRSFVVAWDSVAGHLTTAFPPSRLGELIAAVREAEAATA